MKHTIILFFVIAFHLFAFDSFAIEPPIKKKDSLQVTGKVFNDNDLVRGLIIHIYQNNVKIKTVKVKSSNRFRTNVPYNSMLTVEITAAGFHTKRFIIDSKVPSSVKRTLRYEFDIDIFKESEIEGVNTSILDFPVGLVAYHEKKQEFRRDKKYTKKMKKIYLNLWHEAEMIKRTSELKE